MGGTAHVHVDELDATQQATDGAEADSQMPAAAPCSTGGKDGLSIFNATLAWLGVPLAADCTFTRVPGSATESSNHLDLASVSCKVAMDYTHVNALYGDEAVQARGPGELPEEGVHTAEEGDFEFRVVYFTSSDASEQKFEDLSFLSAPNVFAAFEWDDEYSPVQPAAAKGAAELVPEAGWEGR